MVGLIINFSVSNKILYSLFKPEGGPDPKLIYRYTKCYAHKTGEFFKGFSSFLTVKDPTEGFAKSVLQEYALIFCKLQIKPKLSRKSFFPRGIKL